MRTIQPFAKEAYLITQDKKIKLDKIHPSGLFEKKIEGTEFFLNMNLNMLPRMDINGVLSIPILFYLLFLNMIGIYLMKGIIIRYMKN